MELFMLPSHDPTFVWKNYCICNNSVPSIPHFSSPDLKYCVLLGGLLRHVGGPAEGRHLGLHIQPVHGAAVLDVHQHHLSCNTSSSLKNWSTLDSYTKPLVYHLCALPLELRLLWHWNTRHTKVLLETAHWIIFLPFSSNPGFLIKDSFDIKRYM